MLQKSAIPEVKGQDGGVVTSLLLYALDEGLLTVPSSQSVQKKNPGSPYHSCKNQGGNPAEQWQHLFSLNDTGSLMSAVKQGMNSVAFVGTSCNIDAVTKMQKALTVFCTSL
jgi:coenzyme F420 hydrogenase subunit beta